MVTTLASVESRNSMAGRSRRAAHSLAMAISPGSGWPNGPRPGLDPEIFGVIGRSRTGTVLQVLSVINCPQRARLYRRPGRVWGVPRQAFLPVRRQSVLPVHLPFLTPLLGCVGAVAGDIELQDHGVVDHPVDGGGCGHSRGSMTHETNTRAGTKNGASPNSGYKCRTNLNVKVLDFVQLGGPILTVDRTTFELAMPL